VQCAALLHPYAEQRTSTLALSPAEGRAASSEPWFGSLTTEIGASWPRTHSRAYLKPVPVTTTSMAPLVM
jgi:hypothetical protein